VVGSIGGFVKVGLSNTTCWVVNSGLTSISPYAQHLGQRFLNND